MTFFDQIRRSQDVFSTKCHGRARTRSARKARETIRKAHSLAAACRENADCSDARSGIDRAVHRRGNSAGGSAKQGRDRRYQAILPIRGKLINVKKSARRSNF